jgi:hypothetical protein
MQYYPKGEHTFPLACRNFTTILTIKFSKNGENVMKLKRQLLLLPGLMFAVTLARAGTISYVCDPSLPLRPAII